MIVAYGNFSLMKNKASKTHHFILTVVADKIMEHGKKYQVKEMIQTELYTSKEPIML